MSRISLIQWNTIKILIENIIYVFIFKLNN